MKPHQWLLEASLLLSTLNSYENNKSKKLPRFFIRKCLTLMDYSIFVAIPDSLGIICFAEINTNSKFLYFMPTLQ